MMAHVQFYKPNQSRCGKTTTMKNNCVVWWCEGCLISLLQMRPFVCAVQDHHHSSLSTLRRPKTQGRIYCFSIAQRRYNPPTSRICVPRCEPDFCCYLQEYISSYKADIRFSKSFESSIMKQKQKYRYISSCVDARQKLSMNKAANLPALIRKVINFTRYG